MDPRVRASDAERESYAEKLRQAVGEGRLTINDGDERMLSAYAATYRDELPPLVADLPPDPWHGRSSYAHGEHWRGEQGHGELGHGERGHGERGHGERGHGEPGHGAPGCGEVRGGPWRGGPWRGGGWPAEHGWRGPRRGWFPVGPLFVAALLVAIWAVSAGHVFWPAIPLVILAFIALRRVVWWRRRAQWAETNRG